MALCMALYWYVIVAVGVCPHIHDSHDWKSHTNVSMSSQDTKPHPNIVDYPRWFTHERGEHIIFVCQIRHIEGYQISEWFIHCSTLGVCSKHVSKPLNTGSSSSWFASLKNTYESLQHLLNWVLTDVLYLDSADDPSPRMLSSHILSPELPKIKKFLLTLILIHSSYLFIWESIFLFDL